MPEIMFGTTSLFEAEEIACSGDSLLHSLLGQAISKIRSLQHELDDPNYQYVGRIHRQGILSRNATISDLRGTIAVYEKQITELKQALEIHGTSS